MSDPRRWTGGVQPLWSVTPPPPRVRKYDRLKIWPGPGETVVIVSNKLDETLTHFVDGRSQPCTHQPGPCIYDHALVGVPRYEGWLAVLTPKNRKVHLLSLTAVAVAVEPRLRDACLDLRGLVLQVWRINESIRGEMHAKLNSDLARVQELPPVPDVRFCVERMWAANDRGDDRNKKTRFSSAEAARRMAATSAH